MWCELASEDVEGVQESSLLPKLGHDYVIDLLEQDLNQLLNPLQPSERNVSARWVPCLVLCQVRS